MDIDLTYLNTVSGGDNSFIKDILQLFLLHTMPDAELLSKHIEAKDWHMVSSAAHKIKSSVTMLGNGKAIELVTFIELSAKNNEHVDELKSSYEQLAIELGKMASAINQYIDK